MFSETGRKITHIILVTKICNIKRLYMEIVSKKIIQIVRNDKLLVSLEAFLYTCIFESLTLDPRFLMKTRGLSIFYGRCALRRRFSILNVDIYIAKTLTAVFYQWVDCIFCDLQAQSCVTMTFPFRGFRKTEPAISLWSHRLFDMVYQRGREWTDRGMSTAMEGIESTTGERLLWSSLTLFRSFTWKTETLPFPETGRRKSKIAPSCFLLATPTHSTAIRFRFGLFQWPCMNYRNRDRLYPLPWTLFNNRHAFFYSWNLKNAFAETRVYRLNRDYCELLLDFILKQDLI